MSSYRTYEVTVEHPYSPWDTFKVRARSIPEARKKAKEKYAKLYFRKSECKTYIDTVE